MYFADNHVAEMLWTIKEASIEDGITTYRIPTMYMNTSTLKLPYPVLFTEIKGEWVEKNDDHFFLVHFWENNKVIGR